MRDRVEEDVHMHVCVLFLFLFPVVFWDTVHG